MKIGEALKWNRTLTQLSLEGNIIGKEGVSMISESLKCNTTLTQLNLRCFRSKTNEQTMLLFTKK